MPNEYLDLASNSDSDLIIDIFENPSVLQSDGFNLFVMTSTDEGGM